MGDVSELILNGTLCQLCGGMVYEGDPEEALKEDISPGFPRSCQDCQDCES